MGKFVLTNFPLVVSINDLKSHLKQREWKKCNGRPNINVNKHSFKKTAYLVTKARKKDCVKVLCKMH